MNLIHAKNIFNMSSTEKVNTYHDRIQEHVVRLQQASQEGLRAYQTAIINLDHALLSDLIDQKEAEEVVSQAQRSGLLGRSQQLYLPYETLLEESFTRMILATSAVDLLGEDNITHNYLTRYYNLAANEIRLAGLTQTDHVLFIGSGPFPITAIEYAKQTGCRVDCVEKLEDKAEASRNVIHRLGLSSQIQVYNAEGQSFPPGVYSAILVGVLAQPKQDIIDSIERESRDGTKVLARTTTGLRQFIYPAAEFQTRRFTLRGINQARDDQALSTILLT